MKNTVPPVKKSQSPFQQLISSSISKVKQAYPQHQLHQFNELLNQQQPKKIKQLNIDPYLFVFQHIFAKEELVHFGLKQLNLIIDENYCSKSLYGDLVKFLFIALEKHSTDVVNIVLKIKQPVLEIFELFFQIYSTILLPEEIASKFRNLGYLWVIRIFQMKQTVIPLYFKVIFDKIRVFQIPQLISHEQQHRQLQTYVHKVLNNILNKVQDRIDIEMGDQALILRKQKKGKYLYCFMCQKAADYYCKDTKVPVCGSQCKKDHLLYISEVRVVSEQFEQQFKKVIQELLLRNWYTKRSPSLSVDYLIAIYAFSEYMPQFQIQHHRIIKSPIMIEKVWLLYGAYYWKKGQMFEHIFMSFLESDSQYLEQVGRFYFIEVSSTHRILQIYYNFDLKGHTRLFPLILRKTQADKQFRSTFIANSIENIFQNTSAMVLHPTRNITLSSQILQVFNESVNPIQALTKYFTALENQSSEQQIAWFLLKNQSALKKDRFIRILDKHEDFIRCFLRAITLKRAKSTIDELLREIFYFININVSEKIYRLLELLYQVYDFDSLGNQLEKQVIKKDDAMFQYMYLVIMINTQLHSPNIPRKPSLAQVLDRISVVNKSFASQHQQVIQGMFQRIKLVPFNQQSRGILKNYEKCRFSQINMEQFYLPLVLLQNNEAILQTFSSLPPPNTIVYRICSILVPFPDACSSFLKILLQRLQRQQIQDEYILQAIRNIIQEEPNAVNIQGGWGIIFTYIRDSDKTRKKLSRIATTLNSSIHANPKKTTGSTVYSSASLQTGVKRRRIFQPYVVGRSGGQINSNTVWLDLQGVLASSPLLRHDNFIYFFKDFASTFSVDTYSKEYQKAIFLNRNRLNSMANSLMVGFRKIQNTYSGLSMIEFIASLPQVHLQSQNSEMASPQLRHQKLSPMQKMKNQLILLMLKQIPINQTTQCLLLQTVVSLANSPHFIVSSQLWQCITHLVLKFKSEENQSNIQDLMMLYDNCQEYSESLMIQKTLNSTQPQLINKQVLRKLDKLQPYLNDLSEKVLKMFILKENLSVIQRNLEKFYIFEETYNLLGQNFNQITDLNAVQTFLATKIQESVKNQTLAKAFLQQTFSNFIIKMYQHQEIIQQRNLLANYCELLSYCISANSFPEKVILDKSAILYQAAKQIHRLTRSVREMQNKKAKGFHWLRQSFQNLVKQCQKFNTNISYRKILSQTYTFKHIVSHYQKLNHSYYLISLIKQQIECKKVIWKLIQSEKQKVLTFTTYQIRQLSEKYSDISMQISERNTNSEDVPDKKRLQQRSILLKQKVLQFRSKLVFILQILVNFQKIEREILLDKQFNDQLKNIQYVRYQFLVKILFNGVYSLNNERPDKKNHHSIYPNIKAQPFLQFLSESIQNPKQIRQVIQGIFSTERQNKLN